MKGKVNEQHKFIFKKEVERMTKGMELKNYNIKRERLIEYCLESNQNLREVVKEIAENSFSPMKFNIKVEWSHRMTSAAGKLIVKHNQNLIILRLSRKLFENISLYDKNSTNYKKYQAQFIETIRHELIHYYQYLIGAKLSHDRVFKVSLVAIGGTGNTYYSAEMAKIFKGKAERR